MSTDRRTFVKRVAGTVGAAAAASVVPGSAVAAEVGRCVAELGLTWKRSPCTLCDLGCGLLIGVEDGRGVAVRGDPESPVSRGLACARGYHSIQALYGRDRLRRAQRRRGGRMVDVPMSEALDLVASRLRETREAHGKDSIAMFGSGHSTIPAGYVASKLFKGALGTNNLEADTRLTSGSAMAGLVTSFGLDHPMGCYDDVDHADVFVLWDLNIAELHPVLSSRILEQRRKRAGVRIVDLATRTTRTTYAADRGLLFGPRTDLAVANAIAQEIVARGRVNRGFLDRHVAFRTGRTALGHGLSDDARLADTGADASYDDYVRFLADYSPERVERISGLAAADIRWLASLYADPGLRVMSIWGAALNGHARGTWINNLLYNLHLLVGKIATPGNSPLALAMESSAAGTVREVGMLTEALPGGTVTRDADRERAAAIWKVPVENIDPVPGPAAVSMFRAVERGDIRFLWVQGANPMVTLPNLGRYRAALAKSDVFLVASAAYPTATTEAADVVLPSALWIEEEGLVGSSERRTQHFEGMLTPPGQAMSDTWQTIEVARRLGFERLFPWDHGGHVAGIWAEYARFRDDAARQLAPLPELKTRPGAVWPFVDGRETKRRYATGEDPAADPSRGEFDFYGNPDRRARIWLRPFERAAEVPDREFPFWLTTGGVLEHASPGTLTRRIPTLYRAVPGAYAELNREDADRLGVRTGDTVRLVSRRGNLLLEARVDHRSQPAPGQVFVPDFDESRPINQLTLDAFCPLSGQPDYGCAIRVERVGASRRT